MDERQSNWAGNYQFQARAVYQPETVEEAQELVARGKIVKALGTRHSFNDVADTTGDHISVERLNRVVSLDREASTVTVEAGITYGKLSETLYAEGFALRNLASLPHISVGGSVATATHGSGVRNGSLSTAVSGIEMITADGSLKSYSTGSGDLAGTVVGLGALGLTTRLTLDVVPTFEIRQSVYRDLPFETLGEHCQEILAGGYSVSLFTTWSGSVIEQVWVKEKLDGLPSSEMPASYFGALAAKSQIHMIPELPAENCTAQLGVPGPWHERLPHFKMNFLPSAGEELQAEFFVPLENAFEAISAVRTLGDRIAPLLHITEIRTIAADNLWMSPFRNQASVAIHFTWKKMWPEIQLLLPEIEEKLAPFGARPHWGKLFTMKPERLRGLYEKLGDFRGLAEGNDPDGKFRNGYLNRGLFQ